MPEDAPFIINPYAVMKSLEDQYNYAIATGVTDPAVYSGLQAQASRWAQRWSEERANGTGVFNLGAEQADLLVNQMFNLSGRAAKSVENAGLAQLGAAREDFVSAQGDPDSLAREVYDLVKNQGVSLEDAVRIMAESGQYSVTDLQRIAGQVDNPKFDPAALLPESMKEGETPLPYGPGGGGKRFEPVAQDLTTPQEEFQKSFAQFTRQLETTSSTGKAPELSALAERYQDLFNKYLGEIEARKTRGEEPENVFKEAFVNIGKSTDPQFDQTEDRLQLQTVRPTLSAFDFLTKNVDPEDVLASTPFEQRPGRSTGGFRGYVRRTNT